MNGKDPPFSSNQRKGGSSTTAMLIRAVSEINDASQCHNNGYIIPQRLGIIHLLAWITCSAILLKIDTAIGIIGPFDTKKGPGLNGLFQYLMVMLAAVYSAGFVSAVSLWNTKRKCKEGFLQPGHWILIIDSVMVLFAHLFLFNSNPRLAHIYGGVEGLSYLIGAAGCVIAVRKINAASQWWIFFISLCVYRGICGMAKLLIVNQGPLAFEATIVSTFCAVVLFCVYCYTVYLDLHNRRHRDRMHWLGVWYLPLSSILIMVYTIQNIFIFYLLQR
jgi:hypothetical protein